MRYLDTSALLRLWTGDDHADALRSAWPDLARDGLISSELLRLETARVLWRRPDLRAADAEIAGVVDAVAALPLDRAAIVRAADLPHPHLGSLDAVHLASALGLGPGLVAILTYDRRLADAARQEGLAVEMPQ